MSPTPTPGPPPRAAGRRPGAIGPGARGDEAHLFAKHYWRLVRLLGRETAAPLTLVEDGVAYAFAKLCRLQPDRERVAGWLRVVARREIVRQLRRGRREPPVDHLRCAARFEDGAGEPVALTERIADPHTVELAIEARAAPWPRWTSASARR